MLFEQSCAELEKRLVVTLSELVQDQQPRCIAKGVEKRAEMRVELNAHTPSCNNIVACQAEAAVRATCSKRQNGLKPDIPDFSNRGFATLGVGLHLLP